MTLQTSGVTYDTQWLSRLSWKLLLLVSKGNFLVQTQVAAGNAAVLTEQEVNVAGGAYLKVFLLDIVLGVCSFLISDKGHPHEETWSLQNMSQGGTFPDQRKERSHPQETRRDFQDIFPGALFRIHPLETVLRPTRCKPLQALCAHTAS